MKILHVIDSGGLYGAEVVLLHLVTEQMRMGLQAEIASIGTPGLAEKPFETMAIEQGAVVHKFRMRNGPNFAGGLRIARFARQAGFALLHTHGYKGNILLGFLPRALRPPMVSTLHGWTSVERYSKMSVYQWLDRQSLRRMDAVALVNPCMRNHPGLRHVHTIRLHVVNNGIPLDDGAQRAEVAPAIQAFCRDHFVIGAICRFSPEKGVIHLVNAFALLRKRHRQARLLLIGDGPQRGLIEQRIQRAGLHRDVLLTGYLSAAPRYLSLLDTLVLPSLTEGLPITLLEAMRAGVPVVATAVGGIPQVLRQEVSGLLAPPGNAVMLANAIDRLLQTPALGEALAKEARRDFRARYTSERMADSYRRLYEKILQSGSHQSPLSH